MTFELTIILRSSLFQSWAPTYIGIIKIVENCIQHIIIIIRNYFINKIYVIVYFLITIHCIIVSPSKNLTFSLSIPTSYYESFIVKIIAQVTRLKK